MSTFVKHETPNRKGLQLAWIVTVLWAVTLGVFWFIFRDSDGEGGGFLNFIGRFHVLLVHMPIGIIFLAFVMSFAALLPTFSQLKKFMPFVLWLSLLTSIVASAVGYILMSVEDFAGRAMDLHMYFGIAVVACTLLSLLGAISGKDRLSRIFIMAAMFATGASGHFGGAMVHSPEYLTEHAPSALVPLLDIGLKTGEEAGEGPSAEIPVGEQLVYESFIAPMMAGKCNECHDANKTKGKLRTDTHEFLMAGADGSDFTTVDPGNAEESELLFRSTLPPDDDEVMPPKGDMLTADEVKILELWINAGATTELTVAQLGDDPAIAASATTLVALYSGADEVASDEGAVAEATISFWDTLSPEEQQERLDGVTADAEQYHFSVMPISAEDDRLRINVINAAKEFGDEQIALLEPVSERIVWLDLARSQITDEGLATVAKMTNLERLHLENTAISDDGIAKLAGLSDLEYLNLYGTQVGNGIFETFATLPNLRKVYVWQTEVDSGEARSFERSVNLEINTGLELAAATTPESPEEEASEAPSEKPAESKPEAPKPEAAKATTPKPAEKKPATPDQKPETKPAAEKKPAPASKPAPKAKGKSSNPAKPKAADEDKKKA